LSNLSLLTTALAAAFAGWGLHVGLRRLALSRAKHPSLTGHVRMAKRVACQIPGYRYDAPSWYDVDGAPADIATQRRAALARLGTDLVSACPRTLEQTAAVKPHLSDLQFTSSYRVPFQFRDELMRHVQLGAFWARSDGAWLTDLDGNSYLDVTGSYGVNLLGLDFYKATIEQGMHAAHDLGPLLGGYHACVADNVARLCALSRKDEVSFHMSGTEAVMQAVRLARYHTGRKRLVRFCGAYHGATSPVCWSTRFRRCTSIRPHRRTRRWSTTRVASTLIASPMRTGSNNCARCAATTASYSSSTRSFWAFGWRPAVCRTTTVSTPTS
jgi:glutamate-1-semialdehyde 2,1-aminomutase